MMAFIVLPSLVSRSSNPENYDARRGGGWLENRTRVSIAGRSSRN